MHVSVAISMLLEYLYFLCLSHVSAGTDVPVQCHHHCHHPVLQFLPAEFLDALGSGHRHWSVSACCTLQFPHQAKVRPPPCQKKTKKVKSPPGGIIYLGSNPTPCLKWNWIGIFKMSPKYVMYRYCENICTVSRSSSVEIAICLYFIY